MGVSPIWVSLSFRGPLSTAPRLWEKENTSWWLNQPIWKICSPKLDHFPMWGSKNKKCLKPPPRKAMDHNGIQNQPKKTWRLSTSSSADSQVICFNEFPGFTEKYWWPRCTAKESKNSIGDWSEITWQHLGSAKNGRWVGCYLPPGGKSDGFL